MLPNPKRVEEVYKQLLKEFKKYSGKGEHDKLYDIRLTKLWFKHISNNSEYANIVNQKHTKKNDKKVLNVYITMPNRIVKLIEKGDVEVDRKYTQYLIIDACENGTIFSANQTKDDTFTLLF